MRINSILLIAGILFYNLSFGQSDPMSVEVAKSEFRSKQVISPAPEAAELGKYGNVPISLFTGTPNINIPLYQLKGNSLSLPVSLSYNASGFKPQEVATWVGSNWSLNAGGVITRSVMGNPDNDDNYYGKASLTPPSELDLFPFFDYCDKINDGRLESQPDVYYFNFGGHTGKFVIKPDRSIMKKEVDGLIIAKCPSCIDGFTIKDEQGNTFVFDNTETTHMVPNDDDGTLSTPTYTFTSSWYLTRITSADGQETIDFDYYTTALEDFTPWSNPNESYNFSFGSISRSGCGPIPTGGGGRYFSTPPQISMTRKFLKKVTLNRVGVATSYIDMISTAGQRLDAIIVTDDRMLNQLKIYSSQDGVNKLVKQYDLTYGYFQNNLNQMYKNRLRLDAIQERGVDGITASKPPYQFTYDNSGPAMPDRFFTRSLDHWGFFNNANTGSLPSLVPDVWFEGYPAGPLNSESFPARFVGGHADREPILDGSKATMLNKIQYPTGGYTTFEYELNHADTRNIGGIRIKQMIDYSFENKQAVVKNYSYLMDDGTSSGVADILRYDVEGSFTHDLENGFYCTPAGNDWKSYTMNISANSIYGLGTVQGSHIGYKQVTESQTDLSTGQSLGKTVYKYQAHVAGSHDDDIANGSLLEQDVYDNNAKLLQSTTNNYQTTYFIDGVNFIEVKPSASQNNRYRYCKKTDGSYWSDNGIGVLPGDCASTRTYTKCRNYLYINSISLQRKLLSGQVSLTYDQLSNSYITNTKNFTYNNSQINYPTKIEQLTTDNEKLITEKKYAADYTSIPGPADANVSGIVSLQAQNRLGAEIESVQYRQKADGSNKRFINGIITTYDPSTLNPSGMLRLEINSPMTALQSSAITGFGFSFDPLYKSAGSFKYNGYGNLIEQSKVNDVPSSYVWAYNTTLPVAALTNTSVQSIAYTSFESTTTSDFVYNLTSINNSIALTGTRSCDMTSSSSITKLFQTTPVQQLKISYWATGGALIVTTNATNVISVTKQGDAHGAWTYYEHILPLGTQQVVLTGGTNTVDEVRLLPLNAQMSTYTYEPEIGKTSECNPNNIITYYDYDVAGRLLNIRDGDHNIVKNYNYNYNPAANSIAGSDQTLFYNAEQQGTFYRTCTNGGTPDPVIYKVPYGRYAATNLTDANAKAVLDVSTNGQVYAEQHGHCYFYNTLYRQKYFRNNCINNGGIGGPYWVEVPANTYHSEIDYATAQQMAVDYVALHGQELANMYGTCFCEGEGQAVINGVCETGVRYYTTSTQTSPGHWECTYHYRFSDGSHSINYIGTFSSSCSILQEP